MKILLTNDDGFYSPGIECLRRGFSGNEVWTMAPDGDRSGKSHSITLKQPVKVSQIDERGYVCSGSPADCVMYSLLGALSVKPDLIISGINLGPNLGTDIVYSGTAAAARQGALSGIPSFAISSVNMDPKQDFTPYISFIEENLEILLSLWSEDFFININFPKQIVGEVAITRPARRIYKDKLDSYISQRGDRFYFLSGELSMAEYESSTDWKAVNEGKISISPIFLHPFNHSEEEIFKKAKFKAVK